MSRHEPTRKEKLLALLGGALFAGLVWIGMSILANSTTAVASVRSTQGIEVIVYETDHRGVEIIAADTPLAICYYTKSWASSPSAPFCFFKGGITK